MRTPYENLGPKRGLPGTLRLGGGLKDGSFMAQTNWFVLSVLGAVFVLAIGILLVTVTTYRTMGYVATGVSIVIGLLAFLSLRPRHREPELSRGE